MINTESKRLIKNLRSAISSFAGFAGHVMFPAVCRSCQAPLAEMEGFLCQQCSESLHSLLITSHCRSCGRIAAQAGLTEGKCTDCLARTTEKPFDRIALCGQYRKPLRDLVRQFKYSGSTEYASLFAPMLRSVFERSFGSEKIDYIVPVPLHWRRRLSRGFNQSLLLARLLDNSRAEISTDLVRIKNTSRQYSLSEAQRRRNVKNAFALRKDHDFSGKNICLVDDIITTGATVNECAGVLKKASVNKIFVLVLASAL